MQSFNIASQGPFPVTIEDFPLRNGLLPLSNILLLRVTDLLQQKDCYCYKREDLLKMIEDNRYRLTSNELETIKQTSSSAHNC